MPLWSEDRDEVVEDLFDRHYRALRGLAYVMLRDAAGAEEAVMDAFTKVFSGWNRFRKVDNPAAYLRQMVVNECRARLRRGKLDVRATTAIRATESRRAPVAGPESRVVDLDLWDAVRHLPERQRTCVVLRYLDDLPEAEIARITGTSIGTVKSQLSRARANLEKSLRKDGA